ncbi:MAG: endoglucanase [Saprospiraceae bacterium]|nr:MAG: endoglucanase [Saprospiraceae bacterium]
MESSTTLTAASMPVYGRHLLDTEGHVELISSAAHFGFRFKGTQCQLYGYLPTEGEHNYLQYELDGVYQKRIKISGKDSLPITITAPRGGSHKVWIYKATEAHTGPIFIEKVTGEKLRPLQRPHRAPLIEFIGNSITCGAAADDSEVPCDSGVYHDQHNAYDAYGPRVARALKANFTLSSVSGIGVYRNWNSDGPTLPQVYDKADFQKDNNQLWDFRKQKPAIVSIALGTNDLSPGDGIKKRLPFNEQTFIAQYVSFVQLVKSKYPAAQIVLLSSPVMNGEQKEMLEKCLTAVKATIDILYPLDKAVALYFFKPLQVRGCTGHPSVADHGKMAEELVGFFRRHHSGAVLKPDLESEKLDQ